jgi:hypothetical protein
VLASAIGVLAVASSASSELAAGLGHGWVTIMSIGFPVRCSAQLFPGCTYRFFPVHKYRSSPGYTYRLAGTYRLIRYKGQNEMIGTFGTGRGVRTRSTDFIRADTRQRDIWAVS